MSPRLKKINIALYGMLGSLEFVQRWWPGPNLAFQLKSPQEIWDSGEDGKDEVENYVMSNAYGGEYS